MIKWRLFPVLKRFLLHSMDRVFTSYRIYIFCIILTMFNMFNKILRFQDTDRRQGHRPLSRNSSCPQKTRHTPDTNVNEPNLRTLSSRASTLQTKQTTCQLWSSALSALSLMGLINTVESLNCNMVIMYIYIYFNTQYGNSI